LSNEKFQIPNKLVTDFSAELVVDKVVKIDIDRRKYLCIRRPGSPGQNVIPIELLRRNMN
jgi:hypothetical protein